MARHNIILGQDKAVRNASSAPQFGQSSQQSAYAQPDSRTQWSSGFGPQGGQAPHAPQFGGGQQEDLEAIYARPSATGHDTGRMTMRDALNAITATLGVIVVIGFVIAVTPAMLSSVGGSAGAQTGLLIAGGATAIGAIGGLVLGLVNAFKREPSAILVLLYAVAEGLLLGGISGTMEYRFPGIVLQAVVGTLAVAVTVLLLFRAGILRTSPTLTKIFAVAMIAYLLFGLVNIGYLLFTGQSLRDGLLGLVIGGLAVCMASYSLVMDFEDVQRAANAGVARKYAWRCAFGLAATLVWLYIEILRILAILRGNN